MADATATLTAYSNAVQAVRDHEAANPAIFKEHNRLGMAVIDARNALEDAVIETGATPEDHLFKVVVTPQVQIIYDEARILGKLGMTREGAVAAGLIKDVARPSRITLSSKNVG